MSSTWPKDNLRDVNFWKAVAAECLATMIFVFIGCGSIISHTGIPLSVERIALAFGLAIASLVQVTGKMSGGHINPAVSVAMFARFKIGFLRCLFYVLAQMTGAVCGAAILYGVTPAASRGNLGSNSIGATLTVAQGLGCEVVLTFFLVLVIFASTDDKLGGAGNMTPLAIGLAVAVAHLMGIPFSGASMNPARSFGPAVISNTYKDHWIYWVGPLIGGPMAGWVYWFLRPPRNTPSNTPRRTPTVQVTSAADAISLQTIPSKRGTQRQGSMLNPMRAQPVTGAAKPSAWDSTYGPYSMM